MKLDRRIQNIDDLRRAAQKRVPRVAFDFMAGGAEDFVTLDNNRTVFERIRFRPHTLVDVSNRSTKTTIFGKSFDMPFGVAPTGAAGLYCHRGETAIARAAKAAGIPFVLSTSSFEPMEDVARDAGGTLWFQLYMSKDRAAAERLVLRARDAGYEALVMTTDIPVPANREYNERNAFSVPFKLNLSNMIDGIRHPDWLVNVLFRTLWHSGVPRYRNLDTEVGGKIIAKSRSESRAHRDCLTWDDVRWLRKLWPHKLLVKGILRPDDALAAREAGADGIFVSNHGGRQLDGAVSPIEVLPQIRAAVGPAFTVMADSGFRRGSDIVKALALGADMVFVGRAPLFGVAAAGAPGAARAIEILGSEVRRVLALLGCTCIEDLSPDYLYCEALPELQRLAIAAHSGRIELLKTKQA